MTNQKIAKKGPYVEELDEGTYYWCSCGLSSKRPFCDGPHKGTDFQPVDVSISEKKKYGLCGCKHSNNGAFCDGSHKQLDD